MLKNVTITLEEGLLRDARVMAAQQNTSVSKLVGQMLEEKLRGNAEYWAAFEEFKKISIPGISANPLTREEANERQR